MQAYGGIRQERVEYGAARKRHRHTRALAQTGGRIARREQGSETITSHRAPKVGAGGRARTNAVGRVRLERDTQPQGGAAYG